MNTIKHRIDQQVDQEMCDRCTQRTDGECHAFCYPMSLKEGNRMMSGVALCMLERKEQG